MIKNFIKKPITIQAIQWDGSEESAEKVSDFIGEDSGFNGRSLCIPTMEGKMVASQNDWIIKGIKGEFYPCKPDIFELTYHQTAHTFS